MREEAWAQPQGSACSEGLCSACGQGWCPLCEEGGTSLCDQDQGLHAWRKAEGQCVTESGLRLGQLPGFSALKNVGAQGAGEGGPKLHGGQLVPLV